MKSTKKDKIKVRKSKEGLMNSATKPHKDKSQYTRKPKYRSEGYSGDIDAGYWEDLVDRADGDLSK